MRRKIPPTQALMVFEAAARHENFTRAADALALTQSAVCRQIASLEDFLGTELFRRTRQGVKLTEAGRAYARKVSERLSALEEDVLDIAADGSGLESHLSVAVVPTFANRWLLPLLAEYRRLQPGVVVHLATRTRPFLFADTDHDAAIYAGDGRWPGARCRRLMAEQLIPVCAPGFLAEQAPPSAGRLYTLADLAQMPLLQQATRPYSWSQWFATQAEGQGLALNVAPGRLLAGPRYEMFSSSVEAAALGMGLALVPHILAAEDLSRGRLINPVPDWAYSNRNYYLVIPEDRPEAAALTALADWLVARAQSAA